MPEAAPPNASGTDNPKPPISARLLMIPSGMSVFSRWMCSASGAICSSAKRRNASRTISNSGSRWCLPGRSATWAISAGDRPALMKLAEAPVPARLGAPRRLAAGRAGDEIAEHVGGEDDGEAGLVGAETPVLQCGPRRLEAGGRMGEVVGEDLLVVEAPAAVGQKPRGVRRRPGPGRRRGRARTRLLRGRAGRPAARRQAIDGSGTGPAPPRRRPPQPCGR